MVVHKDLVMFFIPNLTFLRVTRKSNVTGSELHFSIQRSRNLDLAANYNVTWMRSISSRDLEIAKKLYSPKSIYVYYLHLYNMEFYLQTQKLPQTFGEVVGKVNFHVYIFKKQLASLYSQWKYTVEYSAVVIWKSVILFLICKGWIKPSLQWVVCYVKHTRNLFLISLRTTRGFFNGHLGIYINTQYSWHWERNYS